jgi:hypothetical protein
MTPIEDWENQLLLSTFSLTCHSLRLLKKAGHLDDQAEGVIRIHLQLLEAMIARLHPDDQDSVHSYLDTLIGVLPPTSAAGSQNAE